MVMARRIAVEEGLTDVRQALEAQGFEVTKMTSGTMNQADAIIVTGLSTNALGIHDTQGNKMPVIEAEGRTADEVVRQVAERLAAIGRTEGVH